MNKRMLSALVSLAGVFVALYLALYKLGYIGTLVCAVGSCETVQTSRWATLFGFPVATWGVVFYVVALVVSLYGLTDAMADSRRLSQALVVMTGTGVLFSVWLTYLELFVIHAICMWCVVSAILVTILFVISVLDLREVRALDDDRMAEAAARLRVTGYGRVMRNTSEVSLRAVKDEKEE
ncbi:MAG: vitamin K epoxide reductase family protein [Gemmatimonadaceae bacterium]